MTCLAWNDLDLASREDKPAVAAGQTSAGLEKWARTHRMAIMVMSQTISAGIKGAILLALRAPSPPRMRREPI